MLNKEDILALAWEHSEGSGKRYIFTEESLFEFLKELKKEPAPARDEREAFENYMLNREHPVIGWIWTDWFKRGDDPETYANDYVQGAWVMWQARNLIISLGISAAEPA